MFKKRPIAERRPVVGWEGIYEVSEDGRVFRVAESNSTFAGRELKPYLTTNGYLRVDLHFQNYKKIFSVHRLVAEAFLENPENLLEVNHKDCNKQNNHVSNLEWCTHQQNIQHSVENGRLNERIKKLSKAIVGTHLVTGEQIEFCSTMEAGRNGFDQGNISRCCRGLLKQHKDYTWRYKDQTLRSVYQMIHDLPKGGKGVKLFQINASREIPRHFSKTQQICSRTSAINVQA